MRTTLNIEDTLYRELKIRAAMENETMTRLIEKALREKFFRTPKEREREEKKDLSEKSKPYIKIPKIKDEKGREIPLFSGKTSEEIYEKIEELQREVEMESYEASFGQ